MQVQTTKWTSADVLRMMIGMGTIDTVLPPFDERTVTTNYLRWFREQSRRVPRTDPNQHELAVGQKSQRFQSNRLPTRAHDTVTDYWAVEVARFPVPDGHIGYLTGIEQVVNDVAGNYYPTNVAYWGSPRYVIDDVENLRWYLMLSFYDAEMPPRYELFSTVPIPPHALPGMPYTEMCEIDALWYPAHNRQQLKLLVPESRVLRMFLISPPTTEYQWEVSARLTGYIQSSFSDISVINARKI